MTSVSMRRFVGDAWMNAVESQFTGQDTPGETKLIMAGSSGGRGRERDAGVRLRLCRLYTNAVTLGRIYPGQPQLRVPCQCSSPSIRSQAYDISKELNNTAEGRTGHPP
jgi:hypothetical protein